MAGDVAAGHVTERVSPVSESTLHLASRRNSSRLRRWLAWTLGICGVLAAATGYAFLVPPGLPYDEPSHWAYVLHLVQQGDLPVLGVDAVGYEAQMGPIAYVLDALVVKAWLLVGGTVDSALYVVRLSGLLPLVALAIGVWRVVGGALPDANHVVTATATAVAVLNPMVVAMSMSVQNDTIAVALTTWLLVTATMDGERPVRDGAVTGLLAATAILTKLSVAPAVAVILLWPIVTHRRAGLLRAGIGSALAFCLTAWWFIRNLLLYGDLTARAGVEHTGARFPAIGWDGPFTVVHLARSATTYLWLPVEYYRNTISSPPVFDGLMVIGTTVILTAGALSLCRNRYRHVRLLAVVALVSVITWAVTAVAVQSVAFRTAYAALPAYAVLTAVTIQKVRELKRPMLRAAWVCFVVGLATYHLWTLMKVH